MFLQNNLAKCVLNSLVTPSGVIPAIFEYPNEKDGCHNLLLSVQAHAIVSSLAIDSVTVVNGKGSDWPSDHVLILTNGVMMGR